MRRRYEEKCRRRYEEWLESSPENRETVRRNNLAAYRRMLEYTDEELGWICRHALDADDDPAPQHIAALVGHVQRALGRDEVQDVTKTVEKLRDMSDLELGTFGRVVLEA